MSVVQEFPRLSDRYPGWHVSPVSTFVAPGDPHPPYRSAVAIGRLAARGLLDPLIEINGLVAWAINSGCTNDYCGVRLRLLDTIKASAAHTTAQMQAAEQRIRRAVSPLFDQRADTAAIEAAAITANADILTEDEVGDILNSELAWWRRRVRRRARQ